MKKKILAVMFTDMAGFTQRTSRQTHEENAKLVGLHRRILHPLLKQFDGRLLKEMGDGMLAVFCAPTDAVRAAMAIQDRLAQLNQDRPPEKQLRLRIAINVGEVRLERRDVFGEGVNVAARLEAETPVDEIYVSGAAYLTMNRSGIPFRFLGQRSLKGIAEPVSVFSVPRFVVSQEEVLIRTVRDAALPYGGRQLAFLASQRRRRLAWSAAVAALLLGALIGSGVLSYDRLRARWAGQEVMVALANGAYRQSIEQIEQLETGGLAVTPYVDQLLDRLAKERDSSRACRTFGLFDTSLLTDPARRERVSRLRLTHAFRLLAGGELAQATTCLEGVAVAQGSADHRLLELCQIHLQALETLRSRSAEDLYQSLIQYEAFLRVGHAPENHRQLISEIAADAYLFAKARPVADSLVLEFLGESAAEALARRALAPSTPSTARNWVVARLETVAAEANLDWTAIYATQLDDPSCTVRRNAVAQIHRHGQLSVVGLLLREAAKRDRCTRSVAQSAANDLIANGDTDLAQKPVKTPVLVATR